MNDSVHVSLYDLPALLEPMDRTSVLNGGMGNAFPYSTCSTFKKATALRAQSCFKQWEDFVLGQRNHPCRESRFDAECCLWPEVFSKNLTAIMVVMKEALHRCVHDTSMKNDTMNKYLKVAR